MRVRRVKPYVCVDCDYAEHFRFQETKDLDAAAGTWLRCLVHSRAQEQDGIVKTAWLRRTFAGTYERVEELVAVGLLRPRDDGDFEIHAYAPRNQTRAMLRDGLTDARERMATVRSKRTESRTKKPRPTAPSFGSSERANKARTTPLVRTSTSTSPSSSASASSHVSREEVSGSPADAVDVPTADAAGRRPLPASERGVAGSLWLDAFTAGVTDHTTRPCTAGRLYLGTLERLVTHHAPKRDAVSACAWLRDEARAFARAWEGKHPAKGLTPDGLERWLNDGRPKPPEFGKTRIVQPAAADWHADDWSDLGAEVVQ